MSVIHAPEETPLDLRQLLIPGVLAAAFLIFFARLWYIQVVISDDLKAEANRTGEVVVDTLAPRGEIVDREGRPIAMVRPQWVVTGVPRIAADHPEAIAEIARILGIDPQKIEARLKDASATRDLPTVVYFGNMTIQQATKIAENSERLPGFAVDTRSMRKVADKTSLSHILGYVWKPNDVVEKRLKDQGIKPAEFVGRDGIESLYETQLMGIAGEEKLVVNARMQQIRRLPASAPVAGSELQLSLDLDLQKLAQERLSATPSGKGAVVALDPTSGEVLALVSAPTFDLGLYDGGISQEDYGKLINDESKPLFNRAIAGEYSPGSTFKIVNAISAAIQGKLNLNRTVTCNGGIKIGNRTIKCQNHPAGSLSFYMAMTKSCNSYFIKLAESQGAEQLGDTAHTLGIGERSGIDVPNEKSAFCPTSSFINEQRAKGNWFDGHTANMGIGQGELRATPLQMAQIISLVANEGVAYKPHLVRTVIPPQLGAAPQRIEPVEANHLDVPKDFWSTLRRALVNVIESGTAKSARIDGVVWAGKTGSTEHRRGSQTHSWFVGFAPAENPKIAIAVLVENSGHGGEIAAPIGRDVVKLWLDKLAHKSASPASNSATASAADDAPEESSASL